MSERLTTEGCVRPARVGQWRRVRRLPGGDWVGWTLIEMMLAMAIMGTLVAIATPIMRRQVDQAKTAKAIGDIQAIQADISGHEMLGSGPPPTLDAIGRGDLLDPWGNPYQYLRFADLEDKDLMRKDRFLVPINSSYDLYSMGKDGESEPPLTAKPSRDDIVRANDGAFIGPASEF